jgi:hypothetical protein
LHQGGVVVKDHLHLRIIDGPLVESKTWRAATLEAMVAILILDQTFGDERDAIRSLRAEGYDLVEIGCTIDDARQAAFQQTLGNRGEGDGEVVSEQISLYEHCVRYLRRKRVTGELAGADLLTKARELERNVGADANKMLEASNLPGPIDGYPHTVMARTT